MASVPRSVLTSGDGPLSRAAWVAAPAAMSVKRVLAVVAAGNLLANWAMNPVSAVLPTITADLGLDVTGAAWLMNAYFVLLVGSVLTAGKMGDAFGHGLVFRLGCLSFAVGSLLAMLPGGFPSLLFARGVQGLGSAMIFGTSLALVATAFPGPRLAQAVAALTIMAGLSSIVGVQLNAWLVQVTTWHWTFLPPVLLGAGLLVFGGGLPSQRRAQLADVDWLGSLLLFGAVTLLLLGLNHLHDGAATYQAGAPYHVSLHLAALLLLGLFLWRQLRIPRPLIRVELFANPRLTCGVIANGIAHSSMLATGLLVPFLIERGRGYSPSETATLILPMQISLIACSYLGGRLYARTSSPFIGIGSLALITTSLLGLSQFGPSLPYLALFPFMALLGAGLGAFTSVNNTAVMTSVAPDQRGFASGLVEMTRQLGHSLGVSISSTLLSAALAAAALPDQGYRAGFAEAALVMGLVSTAGVLFVLYPALRTRRAALPA